MYEKKDVNISIKYAVEQKENAEQSIERLKKLYKQGEYAIGLIRIID